MIHLAEIEHEDGCEENQNDCMDVNVRGTEVVLDALARLGKRDGVSGSTKRRRRWFVLASSTQVYGPTTQSLPVTEDHEAKPLSVYAQSKLQAERAVERFLQRKTGPSIDALALRLSTIYGVADSDGYVEEVVEQALGHQVIQVLGSEQHVSCVFLISSSSTSLTRFDLQRDLLHIDDCTDAFIGAVNHLSHKAKRSSVSSSSFDIINIASGTPTSTDQLIDIAVAYTESKSPVRRVRVRNPNSQGTVSVSIDKAARILGWRPTVSIEEGLLRLVRSYMERNQRVFSSHLDSQCSPESRPPPSAEDLLNLDGCEVHVYADVQGEFATLGLSEKGRWEVSRTLPPQGLRSRVSVGEGGGVLLSLFAEGEGGEDVFFGIPIPKNGTLAPRKLFLSGIANPAEGVASWELLVNEPDGTLKLVIPGSGYQLKPPSSPGGPFSLSEDMDRRPWRLTPICCEGKGGEAPWVFGRDDRKCNLFIFVSRTLLMMIFGGMEIAMAFVTEYQHTSLARPFLASPARALCERVGKALYKTQRDLATLALKNKRKRRRKMTRNAGEWSNAGLAACSNLCEEGKGGEVCVDTGECVCVLSSCPTSRSGREYAGGGGKEGKLSYPPLSKASEDEEGEGGGEQTNPLLTLLSTTSPFSLLRPQARQFILAHSPNLTSSSPLPPMHIRVGELSEAGRKWKEGPAGKGIELLHAEGKYCITADTSMERGVGVLAAAQAQNRAEGGMEGKKEDGWVFVPHYQSRGVRALFDVDGQIADGARAERPTHIRHIRLQPGHQPPLQPSEGDYPVRAGLGCLPRSRLVCVSYNIFRRRLLTRMAL